MGFKFSDESFVAFLLFAGKPPAYMPPHNEEGVSNLDTRLAYVRRCDEFVGEYFNHAYPTQEWVYFYREFNKWLGNLEFYALAKEAKANEQNHKRRTDRQMC